MNDKAKEIGLNYTKFGNSTGIIIPTNTTTVKDVAIMSSYLINNYPELYYFFGEKQFTWNRTGGDPITQDNRNPLLYKNMNVDGLRTSYNQTDRYGLASSMYLKNNDDRLIVVGSGFKTKNDRSKESAKLLTFGKINYHTFKIAKKEPSQTQKVAETVSLQLNKNEVDAIFSAVNSCWSIPLGLPYNQDLSVKIKVKFDPSGNAIRTEIIDFAKINKKGNAYLKVLAESALRAIKLCSPIRAPKDKYDLWKEVVFNFDAKDVLNGTESKDTKIAKNNLLNKAIETQIAKTETTTKPKKKVKVVKKEPKQEEFKPKKTNQDNEAPVIEIAEAITVNDTTYILEGRVTDKADKIL